MNVAASPQNAFLRALNGFPQETPPIWLMRQAGRYLPEYRAIRAATPTFLDLCYNPALAAEVTLQPIRRFGFDAAILFSDILVVPDALGQTVTFESGEGPRLAPIDSCDGLTVLRDTLDLGRLESVFETVERVRAKLPSDVALIGFCGAPWTVASYMIAGRGTADQAPARLFAYRHRRLFEDLIALLVETSADYLIRQLKAGAQAVQIFDSWAGVLPAEELERWCVQSIAAIVAKVRAAAPHAPIIAFPRGAGAALSQFALIEGLAAIGLDTTDDPGWATATLPAAMTLQGNLDPLALLAGGSALDEAVGNILAKFARRPHIFNLGHGVLPETPIAHVEQLMKRVRGGC
jgi:uroporphyrinogen decarboxylase